MLYNNLILPDMYFGKHDRLNVEENYLDTQVQDNVFDPLELSKPSFTENEIKIIADKISDKLIKLVETQLQGSK